MDALQAGGWLPHTLVREFLEAHPATPLHPSSLSYLFTCSLSLIFVVYFSLPGWLINRGVIWVVFPYFSE